MNKHGKNGLERPRGSYHISKSCLARGEEEGPMTPGGAALRGHPAEAVRDTVPWRQAVHVPPQREDYTDFCRHWQPASPTNGETHTHTTPESQIMPNIDTEMLNHT